MKNFRCLRGRVIAAGVLFILMMVFVYSCAIPARQAYTVNGAIPVGSIQGDYFVGKRYPFQLKIPAGWQASTQYPEFLVDQGYNRESLRETPFFLFNPRTKSSIQFDFSPAGRTVRFSQEMIENLTRSGAGGIVAELRQEHGRDFPVKLNQAVPARLKGVPYASRMSAEFSVKGETREQGWVYAFAEPFQIFILYLITDKDRLRDQEALEQAFSSFEYRGVQ